MSSETEASPKYSPLGQLTLARIREFFRQPEAIFWVYGFPLLMAVALGLAFRNQPVEKIQVDVLKGSLSAKDMEALKKDDRIKLEVVTEEDAIERLQRGDTDLIISLAAGGKADDYTFRFEPNRSTSVLARNVTDSVLVRARAGDISPKVLEETIEVPGSRYIDFLIPGLIGMNLMGGGMWGVGFVTVDLRVRKLLKRFLATPMKRHHYLLALMLSRLIFGVPEVLVLLLFAYLVFGVTIQGSILSLIGIIILGGAAFSGIGLLVASRAKTIEAVSGLMNLVMLPMWLLSGVFFSWKRFPEEIHPFIQALPLTALNNALRAIMLEGEGITQLGLDLGILTAWGIVCFGLALKIFRWK